MPTDAIVVYVTVPDADEGARIGKALVEASLAACVSVVPGVRSIYRWEGKICDDAEALLVIKTRAGLFERLRARGTELHRYDVPEIVALPIVAGHAPYLDWIDQSTAQS